jgi:hypothetical protein
MRLKFIKSDFSVCKLRDLSQLNLSAGFYFVSKTPDEISLVCFTEDVPGNAVKAEHGWKAFRVEGPLDFALVGILARISAILTTAGISLFAVSTYDTDYIMVKADKIDEAREEMLNAGYEIC